MSNSAVNQSTPKRQKRMVPLRYVLTPIAIIFAAIIVLILVGMMAPKPPKKPVETRAPLVDVLALSPTDVQFTIASHGSVMPRTETVLISEVSGMVSQVSDKFVVGGFFRKGEQLLKIDDDTYQVEVLQAQSRLESAEAELVSEQARSDQAKDEWLLTGKTLEQAPILALRIPQLQKAKADLIAAQADLREAQRKLARTSIVAPYDAMLKAKRVDVGQYITIGAALADTFAIDYAEVRLPVKLRDVPFLDLPKINQVHSEGSAVELFSEVDNSRQTWASFLTRYEGVVDTSSRVHYVVAQVVDPYGVLDLNQTNEIRIGTFVNAKITGKSVDGVIAIPRGAVHGANTIYLIDEANKLHIKQIPVLRSDFDYVYSQQALAADNRLVLTNLETPVEGMTLRVNGEWQPEQNTKTEEQVAGDSNVEESAQEEAEGSTEGTGV
ncbi:efflux RND transporter periplasmic adaptor subunit [Thalassotalea euphylliae]|uniref:Efflux RND transporter periplasmic adaptor subunit n=1 Tax=Thalassotalea euphylliae TaxID=1655234 RepID=A0A3E0UHZ8_9GAMM|nr:efflux RND transporter periplasmic adaptor subunit [Thalassotalea euphylliae]REL36628.1 efflux RND transporter periplasmic adaptor subunit [Thalassotalea euphylliae]